MRIAVVGAGIAGLTFANAVVDRPGVDLRIYERAHKLSAVGAGIVLWPNALRGLAEARIDPDALAEFSRWDASGGIRDRRGRWLSRTDAGAAKRIIGSTAALHRAHLLEVLARRVPREVIRLGATVTGADAEGVLSWDDPSGSHSDRFDLIVGADGVRSRVRAAVTDAEPLSSGIHAWRFVTDVRADSGGEIWGRDEVVGLVPLVDERTYVYAAARQGHTMPGGPDWPSDAAAILASASPDKVLLHELHALPALATYVRGRVALIGDAAHAMLPFLGQGACQGIEDAVSLAAHLTDLPGYDAERVPRATMIQRRSAQAAEMALATGWRARLRDRLVAAMPQRIALAQVRRIVGADSAGL